MSENSEKTWERPWTTQEIMDNAENWTLAGDVALLNTLKSFANTLITKTNEVDSKLNNLTQRLDETSLRLDIVHNEFQGLRNTQFIESRVYEDDETLPSKEDQEDKTSNTTENEDEESKIKHMKSAVSKGLEVIDKYFDKVEVNVSDTEEESDYVSYLLKPKDIYIDRPLPYVIGSEEWYKKWHVGLVDSSSDSEIEEILDKYSESESESELPIPDRSQIKGTSDTSSELDYSHKTSSSRPVANSTFSDVKQDAVGSSDSDQNSLPVHTPLSNQNFAEQLAAKLGNVINQKVDIPEPEINTRPIQKTTETNKFPGIFFDEPPPLDEDDDFLPKRSQKGLFSGGNNLFDDDEDEKETFTNVHKESDTPKVEAANSKPSLNLFDDDEVDEGFLTNSTLKEKKDKEHATKTPQVKSLFDDDESSDDGIFKVPSTGLNKNSYLKPSVKPTIPLFDDEPPELETKKAETVEASPKKKPAGGVSLFGNTDIFANQKIGSLLKNRLPESSDDSDSDFGVKPKEMPSKPKGESRTITIASAEPKEIKSETKVTENTKIAPRQPSEGIIKPKIETSSGDHEKTVQISRDKKIEGEKPKETNKPKKISLFGDDEDENNESKGKKTSLFDDVDDLFKEDLFSGVGIKKFTSSLFDDDDEVKDNLFNSFSPSKNETKTASFGDNNEGEDEKESSNILDVSEKSDYFSTVNDKNVEDIQKLEVEENQLVITENKTVTVPSDLGGKTENSGINEEISGNFKGTTEEQDSSPESTTATAIKPKVTNLFEGNIFDDEDESPKSSQPTNLKFGLFDEDSVAVDDLFSTKKSDLSLLIGQNKIDNNTTTNDIKEESRDDTNMTSGSEDTQKTKIDRPSHISLFRNSPPPDDDDWDTRSDDNDPFFSASEHNERSALFDEPVSRPSYDSSGIGIENTRIEGDVSSFYPYASSSRRLSSDIYNEQQSADSFFITKNRSEPPQLDAIEEKSRVDDNKESRFEEDSVMEITPSGRFEDLYHGSGSTSTEEVKKPDRNQLVKDTKSFETSESRKSDSPEDSIGVSVMGKIYDKKETIEPKDKSMPEPEKESKSKIATMKNQLENSAERANEKVKPFSEVPGKLKHSLQINVNALIPGSAPPKRKELTKSLSFEPNTADEPDFTSLPATTTGFRMETDPLENRKPLERSSSFDSNLNEVEVLQSITKDRARVPLRRKPSTRRGRKELRKVMSVDIDQLEQNDLSVAAASGVAVSSVEDGKIDASQKEVISNNISEQISQSKEKPAVSDKPISSMSTENNIEPQLIDSTPVITPEVSEAVIIRTKQSRDRSSILFDDEDHSDMGVFPTTANSKGIDSLFDSLDSDSHLFGSNVKPVNVSATKKTETIKRKSEEVTEDDETSTSKKPSTNEGDKSSNKKTDIFSIDDEDDNDDIFSNVSKKLPVKLDFKNKPLFDDDDDDDDDLFGSSSLMTRSSTKSDDKKSIPQKPRVAKTTVKKLENIKTEDDPLSSLLKDDIE